MRQNTPPHDVVIAPEIRVSMRDGVRLATDLYLPARDGQALPGPWPALLVRTPYDKGNVASDAAFYARHGYLVAVQDCRGRYKSEGRFFPFVDEPQDGYDTVGWLAAHAACDGQVGTWGSSHLAWVQFHMATQAPTALKTMIPRYGPTNAFHQSMREGGALHLWWLGWMIFLARQGSHAVQAAPHLARALQAEPLLPWLAGLPWQRGQSPLRHVPEYEEALFQLMEEDRYSDFWRQPGLAMDEQFERFPAIPILWIGGWYDYYPHAISDSFARFVALGRKDQYLLMGPWDHSGCAAGCGDVWFGPPASVTLRDLQLRWFDHWLKGEGELPFREPVRVFMMGEAPDGAAPGSWLLAPGKGGPFPYQEPAGVGRPTARSQEGERSDLRQGQKTAEGHLDHGGAWRDVTAWPPPEGTPRRYYLQPGGGLSPEPPREASAATSYTYDPRDPVPSLGWCYVSDAASGYAVPPGPRDLIQPAPLLGRGQAGVPLAARRDVLVFQSAPLAEELRVIGPIEARLWIASDAPDTDFTARLSDLYPPSEEYPAGYALPVGEGILRARFRESMRDPIPLLSGQPTEIRITVSPTANCFRAGHRLRLDISSSNFPRFEPNRNTWTPDGDGHADRRARAAENRVFHDAAHPSHVTVWVV
jgi:predicted acyl esterase